MKVISVIQPWATLIALGEKEFETRSWATEYRGEIGIHASKKIDREVCRQEPFRSVLAKHGYDETNLPTGAIIAVGNLTDCLEITKSFSDGKTIAHKGDIENLKIYFGKKELAFGWYAAGRYAWELLNMKQIEPIPAKGRLRFWNYELNN